MGRKAERVIRDNGPHIGAVSRSRAAHQGQSSGPNEVSKDAKEGAERLTAPLVLLSF